MTSNRLIDVSMVILPSLIRDAMPPTAVKARLKRVLSAFATRLFAGSDVPATCLMIKSTMLSTRIADDTPMSTDARITNFGMYVMSPLKRRSPKTPSSARASKTTDHSPLHQSFRCSGTQPTQTER